MAKKRKTRRAPENETYEIEVQDWEFYNHFGINIFPNDYVQGDFSEDSSLSLMGKIVSPILKNATKATINIWEKPELDDHWKETPSDKPPSSIGSMQFLRDNETLHLMCWVPSRSFKNISVAVASGKIKHALVFGEKLKWRRGNIFYISLSTSRDEE
jgi:hypothetical protein